MKKTNKLASVIRKIVREEVQREVRAILSENKLQRDSTQGDGSKLSLTEALSQTELEAYPTAKSFNAADARAGFASMQGDIQTTPNAFQGHSGRVIDASKIDPSVTKALTRDYSKLVQRFKK